MHSRGREDSQEGAPVGVYHAQQRCKCLLQPEPICGGAEAARTGWARKMLTLITVTMETAIYVMQPRCRETLDCYNRVRGCQNGGPVKPDQKADSTAFGDSTLLELAVGGLYIAETAQKQPSDLTPVSISHAVCSSLSTLIVTSPRPDGPNLI